MSRVNDRQHLEVESRVAMLEEDMDSVARDVRTIKALLWTLVFALTTAVLLLAVDLANGSNLTIT